MSHVVTAAAVVVRVGSGERYLYRGTPVPRGVSESDIERLVARRMIEAAAAGEPSATVPSEPSAAPDVGVVELESADTDALKAYAKDNGIALGKASSRDQILAVIKAAQAE